MLPEAPLLHYENIHLSWSYKENKCISKALFGKKKLAVVSFEPTDVFDGGEMWDNGSSVGGRASVANNSELRSKGNVPQTVDPGRSDGGGGGYLDRRMAPL